MISNQPKILDPRFRLSCTTAVLLSLSLSSSLQGKSKSDHEIFFQMIIPKKLLKDFTISKKLLKDSTIQRQSLQIYTMSSQYQLTNVEAQRIMTAIEELSSDLRLAFRISPQDMAINSDFSSLAVRFPFT